MSKTKSKEVTITDKTTSRPSSGCLVSVGVIIGFIIATWLCHISYGVPFLIGGINRDELRSVMETYYFGEGLAELTGNTSILENVVTEQALQRQIHHCNRGLCDGSYLPHAIGLYFKVVNLTEEYAVVELERRPVITDLDRKPGSYLRICYVLIHDDDNWRVNSAYLDCNKYLPNEYKQ